MEGGKPENTAKTGEHGENRRNRDENQQQAQPTLGANSGIRTWATLVGG